MSYNDLNASINVNVINNIMSANVVILSEVQNNDLTSSIDPIIHNELDASIYTVSGDSSYVIGSISVTTAGSDYLECSIIPQHVEILEASITVSYYNLMTGTAIIVSDVQTEDLNASISPRLYSDLNASISVRRDSADFILGSIKTVYASTDDLDSSISVFNFVYLDASIIVSYYNKMTGTSFVLPPPAETVDLTVIKDAFVRSSEPTLNYGIEEDMLIGKSGIGEYFRSILQFDLTTLPANMQIESAELILYHATNHVVEIPLEFYYADSSWEELGVTWANLPTYTNLITEADSGLGFDNINVDITTAVQDWYTGSVTNNGLIVVAKTESTAELIRYFTKEGSIAPILRVTYFDPILRLSLGRSYLDASINVIAKGYSDLDCSLTPKSYDVDVDLDCSITTREPGDLYGSINVSRPDLDCSIYVVQATQDDLDSSIDPIIHNDLSASIEIINYINVTDEGSIDEVRAIDKEVLLYDSAEITEYQYFGKESTDFATLEDDLLKELNILVSEDLDYIESYYSATGFTVTDSITLDEYLYFPKDVFEVLTSTDTLTYIEQLKIDSVDSDEVFNKSFDTYESYLGTDSAYYGPLATDIGTLTDNLVTLELLSYELVYSDEVFNKEFDVREDLDFTEFLQVNLFSDDTLTYYDYAYKDNTFVDDGTLDDNAYIEYKEVIVTDSGSATETTEFFRDGWEDLNASITPRIKDASDIFGTIFSYTGIHYVELTLDTTAPENIVMTLNNGNPTALEDIVPLDVTTTDPETAGYLMKVWGDVNPLYNLSIQTTEGASSWMPYDPSITVMLSTGFGDKNIYVRLVDDVGNETGIYNSSTEYQIHNNPYLTDTTTLLTDEWYELDLVQTDTIIGTETYEVSFSVLDTISSTEYQYISLLGTESLTGTDSLIQIDITELYDSIYSTENHWIEITELYDSGSTTDTATEFEKQFYDSISASDYAVQIDLTNIYDSGLGDDTTDNIGITELYDSGSTTDTATHFEKQFIDYGTATDYAVQIDLTNILDTVTFIDKAVQIDLINLYDSGSGADEVFSREILLLDSGITDSNVVRINIDDIIDVYDFDEFAYITLINLTDYVVATDTMSGFEIVAYESIFSSDYNLNINIEELYDSTILEESHWIGIIDLIDNLTFTDIIKSLEIQVYEAYTSISQLLNIEITELYDSSSTYSETHWIGITELYDMGTSSDYSVEFVKAFYDEIISDSSLVDINLINIEDLNIITDKAIQIDLTELYDLGSFYDVVSSVEFYAYDTASFFDSLVNIHLINITDTINSDESHWISLINISDDTTGSDYASELDRDFRDVFSIEDTLRHIEIDTIIDVYDFDESAYISIIELRDYINADDVMSKIESAVYDSGTLEDTSQPIDIVNLYDSNIFTDSAIQIDLINLSEIIFTTETIAQFEIITQDYTTIDDRLLTIGIENLTESLTFIDKAVQIDLVNIYDSGYLEDLIKEFEVALYDFATSVESVVSIGIDEIIDVLDLEEYAYITLINLVDTATSTETISEFEAVVYDSSSSTDDVVNIEVLSYDLGTSLESAVIYLINLTDTATSSELISEFETVVYDSSSYTETVVSIGVLGYDIGSLLESVVIGITNLKDYITSDEIIAEFESVVYDNGSTDDTVSTLEIDNIIDVYDFDEFAYISLINLTDSAQGSDYLTQFETVVYDNGTTSHDMLNVEVLSSDIYNGTDYNVNISLNVNDTFTYTEYALYALQHYLSETIEVLEGVALFGYDYQGTTFVYPYEEGGACEPATYVDTNPKWGQDILPTDEDYPLDPLDPNYGEIITVSQGLPPNVGTINRIISYGVPADSTSHINVGFTCYVGYGKGFLDIDGATGPYGIRNASISFYHDGELVYRKSHFSYTPTDFEALAPFDTTTGSPYITVNVICRYDEYFDSWTQQTVEVRGSVYCSVYANFTEQYQVLPSGYYYPTWFTGTPRVQFIDFPATYPTPCDLPCEGDRPTIKLFASADWLLEGYDWDLFQHYPIEGLYDLNVDSDDYVLNYVWKFSQECLTATDTAYLDFTLTDSGTISDTAYISYKEMYKSEVITSDEAMIDSPIQTTDSVTISDDLVEVSLLVWENINFNDFAWYSKLMYQYESYTFVDKATINLYGQDLGSLLDYLVELRITVFEDLNFNELIWSASNLFKYDSLTVSEELAYIGHNVYDSNLDFVDTFIQIDLLVYEDFIVTIEGTPEFKHEDYGFLEDDLVSLEVAVTETPSIEESHVIYINVFENFDIEDRKTLTVDGVIDVYTLDESAIIGILEDDIFNVNITHVISQNVWDTITSDDYVSNREFTLQDTITSVDYSLLTVRESDSTYLVEYVSIGHGVWDIITSDEDSVVAFLIADSDVFTASEFVNIEAFIYLYEYFISDMFAWITIYGEDIFDIYDRVRVTPIAFEITWIDYDVETTEKEIEFDIPITDYFYEVTEKDIDFDIIYQPDMFEFTEIDFTLNFIQDFFEIDELDGFDISYSDYDTAITETDLGITIDSFNEFRLDID